MDLAGAFDGEIISADSRQVYRQMDIGTAKPSPKDRSRVPHHLLDILEPDQDFSLALFLDLTGTAIRDIRARSRLPMVVGGTGQYVRALLEGWQVPHVPPDSRLRQGLEEQARQEGPQAIYRTLQEEDPAAASRIDPRNLRRVVRALEVARARGGLGETLKVPPPYRTLTIGLTTARELLYQRIDRRVDEMVDGGLIQEVRGLLAMGYSPGLPSLSSMGYQEIVRHLGGQLTLEKASDSIKHRTHRFARRQYAWFRPGDQRIRWLDAHAADMHETATALVQEFLRGKGSVVQ